MAIPISQLLGEQPTNYAEYTGGTTDTNKEWTKDFHPIARFRVRSRTGEDDPTTVYADWDGPLLPLFADDDVRMGLLGSRPNPRRHYLGTEADCAVWFHTEVSNIVLSALTAYPEVLQINETKPHSDSSTEQETEDVVYTLPPHAWHDRPLAIGEWKRNLIKQDAWRQGCIEGAGAQMKLSRELRG